MPSIFSKLAPQKTGQAPSKDVAKANVIYIAKIASAVGEITRDKQLMDIGITLSQVVEAAAKQEGPPQAGPAPGQPPVAPPQQMPPGA